MCYVFTAGSFTVVDHDSEVTDQMRLSHGCIDKEWHDKRTTKSLINPPCEAVLCMKQCCADVGALQLDSSDLLHSFPVKQCCADVGALQLDSSDLHSYNSGLREVLDKHAPLRHRRITDRPSAPWLTVQIKKAKQQRRCAERRWRNSGLSVRRQIFIHHREKVKKLFLQAKDNYVPDKIESSSICKNLFHIKDQLSGKRKDSTLPSSIATVDLCDTFGDFFSAKIQKLRDEHDATSGQPDFTKQKELKQS